MDEVGGGEEHGGRLTLLKYIQSCSRSASVFSFKPSNPPIVSTLKFIGKGTIQKRNRQHQIEAKCHIYSGKKCGKIERLRIWIRSDDKLSSFFIFKLPHWIVSKKRNRIGISISEAYRLYSNLSSHYSRLSLTKYVKCL